MAVEQCLMASCELGEIRKIYSKDAALGQCRKYIAEHLSAGVELIPVQSTVAGVKLAKSESGAAAIAPKIAGNLYGVPILAEAVQDDKSNATRFVVVTRPEVIAPEVDLPKADTASLVLRTHDQPGALLQVLLVFANRGLNLASLRSHPNGEQKWKCDFYVDVELKRRRRELWGALRELGGSQYCRIVANHGAYPDYRI
jgi:chorismate mutase/prephenate dehydratase